MSFSPGQAGPSEGIIRTGFDSVAVQSGSSFEYARNHYGASVWGVYPGPTAHGQYAWPVSAINDGGSLGYDFICYYQGIGVSNSAAGASARSGQDDANDAAEVMDHYGWPPDGGHLMVNDIEATSWFSGPAAYRDYIVRWCNIMKENGYLPGLYGSPYMLADVLSVLQTVVWVVDADWRYNGPQGGLAPAHAPTLKPGTYEPSGRSWQYAGNLHLSGLNNPVDALVCDVGFPFNPAPALTHGGKSVGPPAPPPGTNVKQPPKPAGHAPDVALAWAQLQVQVNTLLPSIYGGVIGQRQSFGANPIIAGPKNNR